jgi:hypothetical protein
MLMPAARGHVANVCACRRCGDAAGPPPAARNRVTALLPLSRARAAEHGGRLHLCGPVRLSLLLKTGASRRGRPGWLGQQHVKTTQTADHDADTTVRSGGRVDWSRTPRTCQRLPVGPPNQGQAQTSSFAGAAVMCPLRGSHSFNPQGRIGQHRPAALGRDRRPAGRTSEQPLCTTATGTWIVEPASWGAGRRADRSRAGVMGAGTGRG